MASKGDAFKAEGEKALKRTTIFGFGKTQKYEDAAEAFSKAGNAYKLSNQWESAGNMFMKASECHAQADSASDSLNDLVEAGNCFKKIDVTAAVQAFLQAVDRYNENGRFSQSAKIHKEIAELYEASHDEESAMTHYQQAGDLYDNDNKKQSANPMFLKVATIAALKEDFSRAAGIYEKIGRESLDSNLGKYAAKGHFLSSLLCHMAAGDNVATRGKMEEFKNTDYSFPSSRECGLVEKLIEAVEANNSEDFAQACADFDRITPLDPWKTSMLLKAKRHILSDETEDPDLT